MFNRAISLFALLAAGAMTGVGEVLRRLSPEMPAPVFDVAGGAPPRGKRRRRHATRCGMRGSRRAHYARCSPLNALTHHSDGRRKAWSLE